MTPSRPGYGKTSPSVGRTPEKTADSLVDLLYSLGIDKVFVIGVSAGGPTSIYLASKYPDRVKKLVLESAVTKSWLTKDDREYKVGKVIFNPKLQGFTWFMIRTFNSLFPKFFAKRYLPQFSTLSKDEIMKRMTDKDIKAIKKMNGRYSSGKGFIIDLKHSVRKGILNDIEISTLIIHSKFDSSVPPEHAEYAHENIKRSQLFIGDFWGHLIWIGKRKEKRDEKLIDFLRSK